MKKYISQSVEYGAWKRMITRCHDEADGRFYDYGGRGIKVCERWRDSFHNFLKDMGKRPENKVSLDRINNNGDYCPENCRWADDFEQSNNRRDNVKATIDGQTKTVSEWCLLYDLKVSSVFDRINKRGWSPEEAITIPFLKSRRIKKDGKIKTMSEWCKLYGIYPQSVNRSIRKGLSPEEALDHIIKTSRRTKGLSNGNS